MTARTAASMRIICCITCLTLIAPAFVSAKMVEHTITPKNIDRYGWYVQSEAQGDGTRVYCIDPFGKPELPKNHTVQLVVSDADGRLLASVEPAYKQLGKRHCFQFAVAQKQLQRLVFRVTFIDRPHPSGDFYTLRLAEFANSK